jgi:Ca2+-binding EF-hand superfamily protein
MRMIFVLIDSNNDGTLSLTELQTANERLFKVADSNNDGRLTLEEIWAFLHEEPEESDESASSTTIPHAGTDETASPAGTTQPGSTVKPNGNEPAE